MADILGVKQEKCPHCKEPLVELDRERFMQLHRETMTALEIVFSNRSFVLGTYVQHKDGWALTK